MKTEEEVIDSLKLELNDIITQKIHLQKSLDVLSQEEFEIRIKIFTTRTKLVLGTVVEFDNKRGEINGYSASILPILRFYNKNGELGLRIKQLYSWDLRELKIISTP